MRDSEEIVRKAVSAFASGDMGTLAQYMADDMVVHVPAGLPISGDYRSRDAFFNDMLGKVVGALGAPPQLEVHDFTSSDDHVVGLYTIRAQRDGTAYEWLHANIYHVKDGKIVEFWWNPFDTETVKKALA